MTECPYCKAKLPDNHILPMNFTARQNKVFNAIALGGIAGTTRDEIMEKILPGRSETTLRTCIHGINKVIHPMVIKSRGRVYYLT